MCLVPGAFGAGTLTRLAGAAETAAMRAAATKTDFMMMMKKEILESPV